MKANYLLPMLIAGLLLGSCSKKRVVFKTRLIDRSENGQIKQKKFIAVMSVPRGFNKRFILGDHEKELQLIYNDSSMIYLSDEVSSGSYSNGPNLRSVESKAFDYMYKDSVDYTGVNPRGHWRELKLKYLVVGYLNVAAEKRIMHDEALKSLRYRGLRSE